MRAHLRRRSRPTNAFREKPARPLANHSQMVALRAVWYNRARSHRSLRTTPAEAVGLASEFVEAADIVQLIEETEADQKAADGGTAMPERPITITDPRLQQVYDYWLRKRGTRLAPKREDMKPEDLKYVLPYIYILDVVGPPYRFRYRLAGTGFVEEYGGNVTGKFADEIDLDDVGNLILDEFAEVARDARPMAAKWDYTKRDGRHLNYEHLILPLSSDGKKIDMLFGTAVIKGVG